MKLVYIFLFLAYHLGFAQDPYCVKYSIEEGLPTSNIYSSLEDSNGYMWFATDVGILRFDGYDFLHFNTDDGLGDNEIFKIYEDSQNRLWFLSLNGKLSFYKNKIFYNEKNLPFIKKLSHSQMIMDITEDDSGKVYFLFRDGYISTLHKDSHISIIKKSSAERAFSIWKKNKDLFILKSQSVNNINTGQEIPLKKDMTSHNIFRYAIDANENYFFSSNNNVFSFDGEKGIKPFFTISEKEIIHLSIIENTFWMGTRNGLLVKNSNTINHYFENDIVSSILKDSQGNFWVTTLTSGIRFIPDFTIKKHRLSISNLKIYSLQKDTNNNLWIGTQNGLFIKKNNLSINVVSRKAHLKVKKIRNFKDTTLVISNNIIALINTYEKTSSIIANDFIQFKNNYFIATSTSAYKFNSEKFFKINNIKSLKTIKDSSILKKRSNILAKSDNSLFIGTTTGLYQYKNDIVTKLNASNEELNTSIIDLYFDDNSQNLFVATNSKGLIIMKNDSVIKQINKIHGLNSNGCNSIKKVNENLYFIGTNKGLNSINIKGNLFEIKNYNHILNIKNEKINDIELINNNVYLATNTGLLSFNINSLNEHIYSPTIQIDKILINGQNKSELNTLNYEENNLTINYTGISFKDYGNLSYEYKFNDEKYWTETQNRQIDFKNLPQGKYNLDLRVVGNNGVYSPVKTVSFIIKPPFWKTLPFIFFLVLTAFLITLLSIKKRMRSINKKFDLERKSFKAKQERTSLEKQMIELEQKALRLQMNPHFIFNALNTIKGYYTGGEIKDANSYISKFSKLLRLILENDEHNVSIEKEIEMLELYIKLIQLRYQNIFNYEIKISGTINKEEIGIPPLLLQPIVENAIIHGMAPNNCKGQLTISFLSKNDTLICSVIDNGIGISASKEKKNNTHQSKAIKITRERIQFLNNNEEKGNFIITELNNPSGTQVIIKIPILKLW